MAERIPLSLLYRDCRERLSSFVLEAVAADPAVGDVSVPATPGWTVHDVLAHLVGVAQDAPAGLVPAQGPSPEWTAGHVARGAGVPLAELVARWTEAAAAVEALLDRVPVGPLVLDAGSHQVDVRSALGDTGFRGSDLVRVGSRMLLSSLDVPSPLVVVTEHGEVRKGPPDGEVTTLVTTAFEVFRWRLGRRSPAQLAAMDWSGDPEPFLDHLCIFGPAETDLVE